MTDDSTSAGAAAQPQTQAPRRRRSGRRHEILEIAGRQIAEKGYAEATVRDIGEAAGILSGSLYRHFDSKDTILEELLRTYLDDLLVAYEAVTPASEGSASAALRKLIQIGVRAVHENRVEVTILHDNYKFLLRNPRFTFIQAMERQIMTYWLRVLEEGRATGEFSRELNPRVASLAIMGGIETMVRWFDPRGQFSHEEVAEQYATLHLNGLTA
ncbi:TetR/AcrR family transcriptional regulator [Actinophytocola sp.]|uniref:TetR/AcrR family transcriptional regulator n=1 Tax=Actinophytocola sp. TaxID=1872138 RepID=UPI003D6AA5E7